MSHIIVNKFELDIILDKGIDIKDGIKNIPIKHNIAIITFICNGLFSE